MLKFLGIGAQKCGTSWLCRTLSRHPALGFPGGKEVHFWDAPGNRKVDDYVRLFVDPVRIEGDMTPAYGILTPQRIREVAALAPDLRLIYLIRDPRARAWSSARMALERAEMTHEDASDQWFIDHFLSAGSLSRGDYEGCIRNWRVAFGEERLLIVRFESLLADPLAVANRCLRHLGVTDGLFGEVDRSVLQRREFAGDDVPLRPSLRPVLDALYGVRVASLARYLGEDLSGWLRWPIDETGAR